MAVLEEQRVTVGADDGRAYTNPVLGGCTWLIRFTTARDAVLSVATLRHADPEDCRARAESVLRVLGVRARLCDAEPRYGVESFREVHRPAATFVVHFQGPPPARLFTPA